MVKKILAVDDDYDFLHLLRMLLPSDSYQVLGCTDPVEALDLARTQHPDLVVVDLWLPQRTGYELILDLLRDEATRPVPILVCSGVVEDVAKTLAFLRRQGADRIGVLPKPFSPEALLNEVSQLTSSHLDA
jgi:CheY-like chemotaxis protein